MSTLIHDDTSLLLRIASTVDVADGIRSFELVQPDGSELPPFTAGSHVKVRTPNGAVRKYSLCNSPAERHRYVITVKRDANGQGGSVSMVDQAREGDTLATSLPENAFALDGSAKRHLFIAGGIGITPILSMIRSLDPLEPVPWTLYYLTRSPATTAFRQELGDPALSKQVRLHHDHGDPANSLDLWPVLEKPSAAHIYCCGPRPLMDSVRDMTGHWPSGRVHFESFTDGSVARKDDRAFTVQLARSGKSVPVAVGQSILEAVRQAGCRVAASCESGTCGTCRTGLLAGQAEHRDMVLMPEEHDSQIMICVSRAAGDELTLDL